MDEIEGLAVTLLALEASVFKSCGRSRTMLYSVEKARWPVSTGLGDTAEFAMNGGRTERRPL
jgi:hypothetical protein